MRRRGEDPVLSAFAAALVRLAAALAQPKTEWTRDAAIQRFEFTFELAWKAIARRARAEGVPCASPREALKTALRLGWIADDDTWLTMLDDRNRTTHTYHEATAEEIYSRLAVYATLLDALHRRLAEPEGGG